MTQRRKLLVPIRRETILELLDIKQPADAKIEDVHYDFATDCFVFKLSHPSFVASEDGSHIPYATFMIEDNKVFLEVRKATILTNENSVHTPEGIKDNEEEDGGLR